MPSHRRSRPRPCRDKALEMAVREAQGALEELACQAAFSPGAGGFTILSIEPPPPEAAAVRPRASVHRVPVRRFEDVVTFLMEREARAARGLPLTA